MTWKQTVIIRNHLKDKIRENLKASENMLDFTYSDEERKGFISFVYKSLCKEVLEGYPLVDYSEFLKCLNFLNKNFEDYLTSYLQAPVL